MAADNATEAKAGLRLVESLSGLLERLPSTVETKLVEAVSRCFGRGHPQPEEVSTDITAALVKDFIKQLQQDPTRRHFVVDRDLSLTDDAGWLTLARCGNADENEKHTLLQWAITTVRSLERSVFDQCYAEGGDWKIQHPHGPRGSAVVSNKRTGDDYCQQAFFSDMPKAVAATGRQLGNMYPQQIVVRVLRTAPRASLTQGLTRVLQQSNVPDNVFTLWIRHHERIQDLPGMGRYRYGTAKDNKSKRSVLDLLTAIEDEDDSQYPASPLAYDFVQASQANFQRCSRPSSSNNSNSSSSSSAEVKPRQQITNLETAPPAVPFNSPNHGDAEVVNHEQKNPSLVQKRAAELEIQIPDLSGAKPAETKESSVCDSALPMAAMTGDEAEEETPRKAEEETPRNAECLNDVDINVVENGAVVGDSGCDETEPAPANTSFATAASAMSLLGSPEKPTLLGMDPMGLAMALSISMEVHPDDDTQQQQEPNGTPMFDDILIQPTFSFDEEDKEVAPRESLTPVKARIEDVAAVEAKTSGTVEKTTPATAEDKIPATVSDGPQSLDKEEVKEEESAVASHTESSTTESVTNNLKQETNTKPRQASPKKNKKTQCVGCNKKKARAEFSNSQLRKKKNHRCMECVRANCLGPSSNENV